MPTSGRPLIAFDGVSVRRGDGEALRGVSLALRSNESAAILGPNGAGKSTLIRTITRELYPTAGRVRLFGRDVWDVARLRRRLGVVSPDAQDLCVGPDTAMDIVVSGFFNSVGLWRNNIVTPSMRRRARRALVEIDAGGLADRPMTRLSLGEARRVMIARALVHRPSVLVLDEPTAGLDLQGAAYLRTAMRRLIRAGKTVILVTHHVEDIVAGINRVIFIKNGAVAADGPARRLLTPAPLSRLFGLPVSAENRGGGFRAWVK